MTSTGTNVFTALPSQPDHDALERDILVWWEDNSTFQRLREKNEGAEPFSFVDGPVTANKTLGVHTAWGRTLKDVFQRYHASMGRDLRYQNGFDCQGLWIEVGVEKELGLNSKKEIEEYGLAEFAERCKERVAQYGEVITEQSKRLGMWMDWDNDYYTFSDTNIEYIWRFLRLVHERGWLYLGHRSTEWCPRCGTSISAHELVGSARDRQGTRLGRELRDVEAAFDRGRACHSPLRSPRPPRTSSRDAAVVAAPLFASGVPRVTLRPAGASCRSGTPQCCRAARCDRRKS